MTQPTPGQETSLRISRTYGVSRDVIFRAWTEPERLRHWWAAHEGFTTEIAEVDLRVGGRYRLGMKPPDKDEIYVVGGVYREVSPPEKLVFTWSWETPLSWFQRAESPHPVRLGASPLLFRTAERRVSARQSIMYETGLNISGGLNNFLNLCR